MTPEKLATLEALDGVATKFVEQCLASLTPNERAATLPAIDAMQQQMNFTSEENLWKQERTSND